MLLGPGRGRCDSLKSAEGACKVCSWLRIRPQQKSICCTLSRLASSAQPPKAALADHSKHRQHPRRRRCRPPSCRCWQPPTHLQSQRHQRLTPKPPWLPTANTGSVAPPPPPAKLPPPPPKPPAKVAPARNPPPSVPPPAPPPPKARVAPVTSTWMSLNWQLRVASLQVYLYLVAQKLARVALVYCGVSVNPNCGCIVPLVLETLP